MIVSLVATGLFLFVLFVAAVRKFTFFGLKVSVMLFAAAGIYFVWNPDQMTRLAQLVGVGRGAECQREEGAEEDFHLPMF